MKLNVFNFSKKKKKKGFLIKLSIVNNADYFESQWKKEIKTKKFLSGHSMATDTAKKSMFRISFKFGVWKLHASYSELNNICFIKIDQVVFEIFRF